MAKSTTYSQSILELLLNATPITGVADNAATSPLTDTYVALHTADPGPTGNQSSSEVTYTGYARVAVARSNSSPAWTVTTTTVSGTASPNATISFPAATGGTDTATYWSVGAAVSGSTEIFYSGPISPSISISSGVTPELTTASTIDES